MLTLYIMQILSENNEATIIGNQNIAMFFEAKYFAQMESVWVFKLGSQSLMEIIS